jgi:lipid-A-disaccharide synthase
VAEAARATGTKVLYYIAPQLWAWRPGRARRLAAAVDRLAVVLPFEQPFFGRLGLRSEYVGHPLVDRGPAPTRAAARTKLGIPPDTRVLGLLPGSRHQEIRRMWPPFRDTALRLLGERCCERVLVAGTAGGEYPEHGPIEILRGEAVPLLAAADAVLAKSGTTTLEAALTDTPMVVAYKVDPVMAPPLRLMIKTPSIVLANLVLGENVFPEFIQEACVPEKLADALVPLMADTQERRRQLEGLARIPEQLRLATGNPSEAAANIVLSLAQEGRTGARP